MGKAVKNKIRNKKDDTDKAVPFFLLQAKSKSVIICGNG